MAKVSNDYVLKLKNLFCEVIKKYWVDLLGSDDVKAYLLQEVVNDKLFMELAAEYGKKNYNLFDENESLFFGHIQCAYSILEIYNKLDWICFELISYRPSRHISSNMLKSYLEYLKEKNIESNVHLFGKMDEVYVLEGEYSGSMGRIEEVRQEEVLVRMSSGFGFGSSLVSFSFQDIIPEEIKEKGLNEAANAFFDLVDKGVASLDLSQPSLKMVFENRNKIIKM